MKEWGGEGDDATVTLSTSFKSAPTDHVFVYVDYCVELLLFVLVSCKTTPPTTKTEMTLIKSFNFEDSLQSLYAWMPVLQCTSDLMLK